VRVGPIIIPGFLDKEPAVESVIMVNPPTSALKDIFQREKPTSKFFQRIKKLDGFYTMKPLYRILSQTLFGTKPGRRSIYTRNTVKNR
jgi:hypothetical protein